VSAPGDPFTAVLQLRARPAGELLIQNSETTFHEKGALAMRRAALRLLLIGLLTALPAVALEHVTEGVVTRVDSAAKKIVVKTADGTEEVFKFTGNQERYDGTGYPRGLKGENIALGARIFAIADTLDAITSDRPYRAAQSFPAARDEIVRWAGRQFDPETVKIFLSLPPNTWCQLREEINRNLSRINPFRLQYGYTSESEPQSISA
jgi:hypothetical protein